MHGLGVVPRSCGPRRGEADANQASGVLPMPCGAPATSTRWTTPTAWTVAVPYRLFLWNGLGPHFGMGEAKGRVSRRATLGTLAVFLVVVLAELLAG